MDLPEYNSSKRQIENKGFLIYDRNGTKAKVYTPELDLILTAKELDKYKDPKKDENYINTFVDAFIEGCKYFDSNYKANISTLYGENAALYIRDMHNRYFHIVVDNMEGWGFVKNSYPLLVNHETINKYGFYSGIVSKVDDMAKDNPSLFKTFEVCEHMIQPKKGLSIELLKKIHKEYDGKLWDSIKLNEFLSIFDRSKEPEKKIQPIGVLGEARYLFELIGKNVKNNEEYLNSRINVSKQSASKIRSAYYTSEYKTKIDEFVKKCKT